MRCVLENIRLVTAGNDTRAARVAIDSGRIAAWDDACPRGWPAEDGGGLLLLPGAIDPHVHFDDPGYTWREDFAHGSRAALAGGVTTVCDMPDTCVPPVTTRAALDHKVNAVLPRMHCDAAFWAGVSANAIEAGDWRRGMDELWAAGVIGFKTYALSGMESFRHLEYAQFRDVLRHAARLGALVGIHAEDAGIVAACRAAHKGGTDAASFAASRPVEAEVAAIRRVGELAGETGARIHIVHLSSASGAAEVRRLRAAGVDITAETCPQYLAFSDEDFKRLGTALKCAPVVKSAAERDGLWQALGGAVSFLATDHAPCPAREKETRTFDEAYSGMPGVELLLPFALSFGYHAGRLTLEQVASLTSGNAAQRFGLAPRKGRLDPGADADFALVDLDEKWTVSGAALRSKGQVTPFEGMTFRGRVRQTWLRGQKVFSHDSSAPARGTVVRRGGAYSFTDART